MALFVAGSYSLLASDPMWFWDREALHNAGVAREVLAGNGRYLLNLQYMEFCGGCTVESLMGAAAFAVLGQTFVAWKLVPITFGLLLLAGGWALLRPERETTADSLLWLGMITLPPVLMAQSMVMGWGNHFEVFALVVWLAVLAESIVRRPEKLWRWALLGASFVFTCWFSLTGAVSILALAARLFSPFRDAVRREGLRLPLALVAGFLVGGLPYLVFFIVDGRDPFEFARSFQGSNGRFDHLGERMSQLALYAYGGVFQASGGGDRSAWSWASVAAVWLLVGLGLPAARRHPMPYLLLASYGLVYALSPAEPSSLGQSGLPPPVDQRYLFPWFASLLLAAAVGGGALWSRGGAVRVLAVVLTATVVAPGILARVDWHDAKSLRTAPLSAPQPYDYAILAGVGYWRLPPDALRTGWALDDRISAVNAARATGHRMAYEFVELRVEELPGFLVRVREVPLDTRWVVAGIGREIRAALVDLGDFREDPAYFVLRLQAFGDLLTPDERIAFFDMVWPGNGVLGHSLPSELPDGCALCPTRGAALVELPDTIAHVDRSLIPHEALTATGPRRRDLLLGVGSALGVELGHSPDLLGELVRGLSPADSDLIRDGFERGAAGRWRRPYSEATPLHLLP